MANEIILYHYSFSPFARRSVFPRFICDFGRGDKLIMKTELFGISI